MNHKQKKEIIIYSILVFIGLLTVGIIIYHEERMLKVTETAAEEPATDNEEEDNSKTTNDNLAPSVNDKEDEVTTEENKENNYEVPKPVEEPNISDNKTETENKEEPAKPIVYSRNDQIVIDELETLEKNTDTLLASNNEKNVTTLKGVFITLVDFCFYDGTIKGVTFDELTAAGKQKVLGIVNRIDEKIDQKFPNYKEKISSKTSEAFKKVSELIKIGANNINNFAKDKLGEVNYQALIDEKDELVLYTKNAFSLVKNFSTSLWQKTTDKLKSWYEKFKENN